MKLNRNHLLCLSIIFLFPFLTKIPQQQPGEDLEKRFAVDKKIKALLAKMTYIEGDTFVMGRMSEIRISPADSTLFFPSTPKRTIVEPFYLSATEVTNSDWREFYLDKVSELGQDIAKRRFYPDTSLWLNEFPYTENVGMAKNYFSNPKFNDCPVVGVTWDQANAYCVWKTKKIKELLEKKGVKSSIKFRLPTENEWECAAVYKESEIRYISKSYYPWSIKEGIWQIKDLTNIGQIHDINKIVLKTYGEDGCTYPCKVASYPPNDRGIYDLAGNVSEWTSDPGSITTQIIKGSMESRTLASASEIENEIERLSNNFEPKEVNWVIEKLAHNKKVLATNDTKICKGGSWANGLIYAQVGSRQAIRKNNASTKIGFRLAISNVSQEVVKYFPQKKWKPKK